MDKQEGHSVPDSVDKSFPKSCIEEGAVGVQPSDQHGGVGDDGYYLSLSELHVDTKTKVRAHYNMTCIYTLKKL